MKFFWSQRKRAKEKVLTQNTLGPQAPAHSFSATYQNQAPYDLKWEIEVTLAVR